MLAGSEMGRAKTEVEPDDNRQMVVSQQYLPEKATDCGAKSSKLGVGLLKQGVVLAKSWAAVFGMVAVHGGGRYHPRTCWLRSIGRSNLPCAGQWLTARSAFFDRILSVKQKCLP